MLNIEIDPNKFTAVSSFIPDFQYFHSTLREEEKSDNYIRWFYEERWGESSNQHVEQEYIIRHLAQKSSLKQGYPKTSLRYNGLENNISIRDITRDSTKNYESSGINKYPTINASRDQHFKQEKSNGRKGDKAEFEPFPASTCCSCKPSHCQCGILILLPKWCFDQHGSADCRSRRA